MSSELAPARAEGGRRRRLAVGGFLLLTVVLAALVRLAVLPKMMTLLMNCDATEFLPAARTQLEGGPLMNPLFHPLYPLASAWLAGRAGDLEAAAVALAFVAGTLLPVPVFLLGRGLFDVRTAALAALASAMLFCSVLLSCQAYPETCFSLVLYTLLAWFWKRNPDPWGLRHAGFGLLAGAAYLLRPEGFAFPWLLGAFVVLDPGGARSRRERVVKLACMLAAFAFVSLPYIQQLKGQLGHWTITGKIGTTLALAGSSDNAPAFGLTEQGTETAAEVAQHQSSFMSTLAANPGKLARRCVANLGKLIGELRELLGPVLAVLFLVGCLELCRSPRRAAYLGIAMVPLLPLPLVGVTPRYCLASLPAMLLVAARGASAVIDRIPTEDLYRRVAWLVLAAATVLPHAGPIATIAGQGWHEHGAVRQGDEYRQVGDWMKTHCRPDESTTNTWVSYHSGLGYCLLPSADLGRTLAYLRARGCTYVVVDRYFGATGFLPETSPAFNFLLETDRPPAGLEEIYRWKGHPRNEVRVYRLKPGA